LQQWLRKPSDEKKKNEVKIKEEIEKKYFKKKIKNIINIE